MMERLVRQSKFRKDRSAFTSTRTMRIVRRIARGVVEMLPLVTTIGRSRQAERKHIQEMQRIRDEYLSLMVSCLTGTIYEDPPLKVLGQDRYDATLREYGWDWPSQAHTMVGTRRLNNLRLLIEDVIANDVPGDLIETGVWRGGACILMRAVLYAHGIENRRVWIADSFEGLPRPDVTRYPADEHDKFYTYQDLAVSMDEVKHNFEKYGLLDNQLVFLNGWFKDTLPTAPIDSLAILRLDGDMYESTILALRNLYERLSIGGYVIVDDYHVVQGCKMAIDEFIAKKGLTPEVKEIDGVGVYWQKTEKDAL
ncbi:MAG: Macrocin O-methyltransferase [Nitrospira sp.]|nr:MAG: Macrocin O-methyltransferase [Nitrospira sp.]